MPTPDPRPPSPYDAGFYADQVDGSERSAAVILPLVLGPLAPRRVVDMGCGQGAWLAVAARLGATDLVGVDGAWVDRARLRHPAIQFVPADLAGDGPMPEVARADLCISVEVAEHLPASRAEAFVAALCKTADAVLFSAAVPYQGGTDHVNEQRASYWVARFAARDFACLDIVRGAVWDDARVEWWYRQNVLLFVRRASRAEAAFRFAPAAANEGAKGVVTPNATPRSPRHPVDLVHPDAFESKVAYLSGSGSASGRGMRRRTLVAVSAAAGFVAAWLLMAVLGLRVGVAIPP